MKWSRPETLPCKQTIFLTLGLQKRWGYSSSPEKLAPRGFHEESEDRLSIKHLGYCGQISIPCNIKGTLIHSWKKTIASFLLVRWFLPHRLAQLWGMMVLQGRQEAWSQFRAEQFLGQPRW